MKNSGCDTREGVSEQLLADLGSILWEAPIYFAASGSSCLLMTPPSQEEQGLLQALVLFLFLIPPPLRPVVIKWTYFADLCLCGTQENRLG